MVRRATAGRVGRAWRAACIFVLVLDLSRTGAKIAADCAGGGRGEAFRETPQGTQSLPSCSGLGRLPQPTSPADRPFEACYKVIMESELRSPLQPPPPPMGATAAQQPAADLHKCRPLVLAGPQVRSGNPIAFLGHVQRWSNTTSCRKVAGPASASCEMCKASGYARRTVRMPVRQVRASTESGERTPGQHACMRARWGATDDSGG